MSELGWPVSKIMAEHLQNLVSQGYMLGVELATHSVPADPASPTLAAGYVIACLSFYKARIWCAFTPIPPLAAIVLWLRAASSDSLADFAHCGLPNPVRGLHGDCTPL
jgi:hypothetical protein